MNVDGDIVKAGGIVAGIAGSWATLRSMTVGLRSRVARLEGELEAHVKEQEQHYLDVIDRLARIETKLDKR